MPIRQGYESGAVLASGQITPGISTDLDDYAFDDWNPLAYYVSNWSGFSNGARLRLFPVASATRLKEGYVLSNWGDDYYDRVYIDPVFIDLGTIVSPQTRVIRVWNAWRYVQAELANIVINGTPLEITGALPPYTFRELETQDYTIVVNSTGAPAVETTIQFDFSNVADPSVVLVIGTRAVRFGIVPEVPVKEVWQWLTNLMVATDGTEQRIAIRGSVPRVTMDFSAVFVNEAEIEEFYTQLLTGGGRLWVPEYQYATTTTAVSAVGTLLVYFDTDATDVRAGEYVFIDTKVAQFLTEVLSVGAGFATMASPLPFTVPKGSMIVPGAPSLVADNSGINRYAVNDAGETGLTAKMQRYRDSLMRPGVAAVATTYLGSKVLERRPLADDLVEDGVTTGNEMLDNRTGTFDYLSWWNYSRVGGPRQYKVNRVKEPKEMDYWREILDNARGRARMFWHSTYRQDQAFVTAPLAAATVASFVGTDYALKLFAVPTHRHFEVETAAGIHRFAVTNAVQVGDNSGFNISPAWPTGAGWQTIIRVSQLLPVRLDSDEVSWDHYGLESILNLSIRTAEVQTS